MSATILPSFYGIPLVTSLPTVRYDERGRLMRYNETEVQRKEREAFIRKKQLEQKISAWIDTQPRQTKKSTSARTAWALSDPLDIGFISMSVDSPYSTSPVIDISKDAYSYSAAEESYVVYSTPSPRRNTGESLVGSKRGHRRHSSSSSLSSIPEED